MTRYSKKPVVIEAECYDGTEEEAIRLSAENLNMWVDYGEQGVRFSGRVAIETLEGVMFASPGDWIITGVKGEKYPCKPDVFLATYEAMDDEGV